MVLQMVLGVHFLLFFKSNSGVQFHKGVENRGMVLDDLQQVVPRAIPAFQLMCLDFSIVRSMSLRGVWYSRWRVLSVS